MRDWISRNYKLLIILAFLIPIITVAIVSISHVTQWYGISNPASWAIYLSLGIEIAALSSLAALTSNMGRKVYFPFIIVTFIQFIGNIFFSYEFIDIASKTFLSWVELVSPIFEFIGVRAGDLVAHKRILAFFAGGLLPIISLSFLHMLIKFTEGNQQVETPILTPPLEPNEVIVKDETTEVNEEELSENMKRLIEDHLKLKLNKEDEEKLEKKLNLLIPKTKEEIIEQIKNEGVNEGVNEGTTDGAVDGAVDGAKEKSDTVSDAVNDAVKPIELYVSQDKPVYNLENLKEKIDKVLMDVYGTTEGDLPDSDQDFLNEFAKNNRNENTEQVDEEVQPITVPEPIRPPVQVVESNQVENVSVPEDITLPAISGNKEEEVLKTSPDDTEEVIEQPKVVDSPLPATTGNIGEESISENDTEVKKKI